MLVDQNIKPGLLMLVAAEEARLLPIQEAYAVHQLAAGKDVEAIGVDGLEKIEVVVTSGARGLSEDEIRAMPGLRFVHVLGSGTDKLDIGAAAQREITVTSGAGSNAPSVADHALGLALAVLRDIPGFHAAAVGSTWAPTQRPTLAGKACGILGLGAVGEAIAKRLAGFGARIFYHNRKPVPASPHGYCGSPAELAAASDVLFVCCPGGPATHHLVNADVLSALGVKGFLVNVGRGTVVDSQALGSALVEGRIAGAAIDVFEDEPVLPDVLRVAPNLVVTPHVAGLTPDALDAAWARTYANLRALSGEGELVGRLV
ncbi:NAD(P)-dependent oxidoreductase [Rhizobium binxianense]